MQATASDDHTWRLWHMPDGDLIMSGEGHTDWVAAVDFHPRGAALASASGDATVKLWDFAQQQCVATLAEHTAAVWAIAWHDTGAFLASASLDHCMRLWDVAAIACKSVRTHQRCFPAPNWCCCPTRTHRAGRAGRDAVSPLQHTTAWQTT